VIALRVFNTWEDVKRIRLTFSTHINFGYITSGASNSKILFLLRYRFFEFSSDHDHTIPADKDKIMASSRVADPPHQATVRDCSMNTDASEMQIKNHQLSLILDEFEQWATIVPNLSLHQRQEISEHLQEQISQLATFDEPNGTRKQQFIDLERLSKLQQGPLGKLVDYGGFLVIMDDIIRKRLQALSSAAVEDGSEVSYLVIDNLPKQELTCRYVGPRLDGVFPDSYSSFKCWH